MFEKLSVHFLSTSITNSAYSLWDTAKSYLAIEPATDDEGKITEVCQQDAPFSSLISTLQENASWFRYQPKKLLMLTGLALAYYANQTSHETSKELNISYAINGIDFTPYVPFQVVSDWDYLISSSTGTLTQFAMLYGASSLLSHSYQYNSGNLLIAPLSLMALSSFLPIIRAQTIETEFLKVFGGNLEDYGYAVKTTSTGDIVVAGSTASFGAGGTDILVTKFYANSSLAWAHTLGGSSDDVAYALALTPTDDIVLTGQTGNIGGGANIFVIKLYANGGLAWARTLGGNIDDYGSALAIAFNGDVVVTGPTLSFGAGNYDTLITKLYANGDLAWARTLGGIGYDISSAIGTTPTGDIVLTGYANSFGGSSEVLVAKLSANGSLTWARTLGGSFLESGDAFALTSSDDIVITGYTSSFGAGSFDALVAKLYANGSLAWARTLGGSSEDRGYALAITSTNDIVMAGYTSSFGSGYNDGLIAKFYGNGSLAWARILEGSNEDRSLVIVLTPSEDIVVTGWSNSFGAGGSDALLVKLDANGTISGCNLTRTVQPTVLSWGSISNGGIVPTFMSLNTTGMIQDWTNINMQFITPQELLLCSAGNTQSNTIISMPLVSSSLTLSTSLTSNNSPTTSQEVTSILPNTFSSASTSSTSSTSDISTSLASVSSSSLISSSVSSIPTTITNNPSSSSTSPSASQSSASYIFSVSVPTTPIVLETGTSTILTNAVLSITGNVPSNQVIYTVLGNNPDIFITVNGVVATQFTQMDVEGRFVEIALQGVTCGDDYSTDLQLEANIAGSNTPAQQVGLSLILDGTTCTNAGRLSLFSYRDIHIGFFANNKPKERAEREAKMVQSIRENSVNPIRFRQ